MSSKKKKHHKKQQFRASTTAKAALTDTTSTAAAATIKPAAVSAPAPTSVTALVPQLSLIQRDIRRVIILAASFVGIELILWYLFEHTGLGTAVYRLIHL